MKKYSERHSWDLMTRSFQMTVKKETVKMCPIYIVTHFCLHMTKCSCIVLNHCFCLFFRDEPQLLLFLHAILAVLPDDIKITAANQTSRVSAAIDDVMAAIRSEMAYCCRELQSLIVDAESIVVTEPDSGSSLDQPQRRDHEQSVDLTREEFATIQRQVRRREDAKCDEKRFKAFRNELNLLGRDTDTALVVLASSRDCRL